MNGTVYTGVGVNDACEDGAAVTFEWYVGNGLVEEHIAVVVQSLDSDVDVLFVGGEEKEAVRSGDGTYFRGCGHRVTEASVDSGKAR